MEWFLWILVAVAVIFFVRSYDDFVWCERGKREECFRVAEGGPHIVEC